MTKTHIYTVLVITAFTALFAMTVYILSGDMGHYWPFGW